MTNPTYRWRSPYLRTNAPPESTIQPAINSFVEALLAESNKALQRRDDKELEMFYTPAKEIKQGFFMTEQGELRQALKGGRHQWNILLTVDKQTDIDLNELVGQNETGLAASISALLGPMNTVQIKGSSVAGADVAEGKYTTNDIEVTIKIQYDLMVRCI